MRRYEVLVLITGAVVLALEVLASRIMTPYFGVSLYIWSGILSITLAFLAVGYSLGGKATTRLHGPQLEARFLQMPMVSAVSILAAALVYPVALAILSQVDLVLGSFVGATLLLALPLIALSGMNPLLIGMQRQEAHGGDGGAGRVFFISTVGSVAGVLMTAFLFIPNLTNYRGILLLAIVLCVLSAGFAAAAKGLEPGVKRRLILNSAAVAALCALLFAFKDQYLRLVSPTSSAGYAYNVRGEYTSMFGNIKVIDLTNRFRPAEAQRLLVNDGLMQSRTDFQNVSLSHYSYVFEALTRAYVPEAKDVLVLGLGAGIVPRTLKRDGRNVAVVEINRDAFTAAREFFAFDPTGMDIHVEDARTFVRGCWSAYDIGLVDLFLGDNTPDYLLTREFFADLRRCIRPGGAVIVNAYLDEASVDPNRRFFATVMSAFPKAFLYAVKGSNAFIVGTDGPEVDGIGFDAPGLPAQLVEVTRAVLASKRPIPAGFVAGVEPVSDDHNIFSVLFSDVQMDVRKLLARQLSPHVLVN